jgi:4-coumarate--CoA ligase
MNHLTFAFALERRLGLQFLREVCLTRHYVSSSRSCHYVNQKSKILPQVGVFPRIQPSRHVFTSMLEEVDIPEVDLYSFIKTKYMEHPETEVFANSVTKEIWSASRVIHSAEKLAAVLQGRGFQQGDCLCIYATNCPEYAVVCYAVLALGGVVSPANTSFIPNELLTQVKAASGTFLACTQGLIEVAAKVVEDADTLKELLVIDGDDNSPSSLKQWMNHGGIAFTGPPSIDPKNDVALLPYSSGTTGLPKGVMITHYNLVANLVQILHPFITGALPG